MVLQTYEWTGPENLGLQRTLAGSMFLQVGAGLVFLNERQVRALRYSDGLTGLVSLLDQLHGDGDLPPTVLCWNCGETDPEYVSDSCSRCGAQSR